MKLVINFFSIVFFIALSQACFAQLTGEWTDDIGACYKVRQVGNEIYWSMDDSPRVINVFTGLKVKDIINGKWADVPGGNMSGNGVLSLRVESNNQMVKIGQEGNYNGRVWTRGSCTADYSLVGTWSWSACSGTSTAKWAITSQEPNGTFKGHLIDPTNKNTGTLEGTITGKSIRMVRTIPDYGQQIWTGTYDPKKKTFVGNLTNPSCSFSANKL